ncbi:MAG: phosphate ABC transporter ATP-binding protein [Nitrospirota bacterium]|nr:phosphate ABC transporter ATP-binding protein [Nitrospirota bacterium]
MNSIDLTASHFHEGSDVLTQVAPSSTPSIQSENLSVRYGKTTALYNISLHVPQGTITALVGPSGSGKTSLLSCVNRLTDLIPTCLVTGNLRVGGIDVYSPQTDVIQLRRRVGMIFQKPNPFPFSIRKNLEFPLREHGVMNHEEVQQKIQTALRSVGLWQDVRDRLETPALALSGGQQQRLCIARALVLSPQVLLLDEPCSALDPLSSGVVEDLISELRGRYTIMIVTHNLAQARRIADHTSIFWVLQGTGQLIEQGSTRQIFECPQHDLTKAYINGIRG